AADPPPAAGGRGSRNGRAGIVAAGVARSASRLIAPTEVCLSHTKTYRLTTTSAPSTRATQPPGLRAGGPPRFPRGRTDLFLRDVLRLMTMRKGGQQYHGPS